MKLKPILISKLPLEFPLLIKQEDLLHLLLCQN
nr:MAG TPA: hypothetical protein [Caudoviricetes sp.]